jgi:hypothetical protein
LGAIQGAGRSTKIDLKEGGPVIEATIGSVARIGLHDDDLWFNAAVEIPLGKPGFTRLATSYPGARLSCPLDTLASYLLVAPPAYEIVEHLRSWGLNWVCFGSRAFGVATLIPRLQEDGWPVNIWDVTEADVLENALALQPQAVTADLGSIHPQDIAGSRSRARRTSC